MQQELLSLKYFQQKMEPFRALFCQDISWYFRHILFPVKRRCDLIWCKWVSESRKENDSSQCWQGVEIEISIKANMWHISRGTEHQISSSAYCCTLQVSKNSIARLRLRFDCAAIRAANPAGSCKFSFFPMNSRTWIIYEMKKGVHALVFSIFIVHFGLEGWAH